VKESCSNPSREKHLSTIRKWGNVATSYQILIEITGEKFPSHVFVDIRNITVISIVLNVPPEDTCPGQRHHFHVYFRRHDTARRLLNCPLPSFLIWMPPKRTVASKPKTKSR
jgi:hypothetical protein